LSIAFDVFFFGGFQQSLYGDNSSVMYHQGYGYSPYATYPSPGSPAPTMGQDGQLYGAQHYQYTVPYHQAPAQTTRLYPPNQVNVPQREISTSVAADQVLLSVGAAEGNPNIIATGGRVNEKSGSKAHRPSVQNSSLNSYASYERGGSPVGFPSLPTQDPRFGFDEIRLPNTSLIPDGQSKRGARPRSSSPFMHANNISSWRNQNLCRVPHFMVWELLYYSKFTIYLLLSMEAGA
jgi:hypothetical protein